MPEKPYILALDQGTTSSRAILFDSECRVAGVAQREFEQHYPEPGRVEHDATEIWSTQSGVAVEVLTRMGLGSGDIACIGITNQRETTVVWDRETSRPVCPAIVWQDRRTAFMTRKLRAEGYESTFHEKTGLVLDPYFSGTKLRWILDHVDGAREKAENGKLAFGTVDSWLIWNLTRGHRHVTDVTNASRTLLYNIHTGEWDEELLRILDIPRNMLPEVASSSEVYAEASGAYLSGVPISGIAGDQQAALFGQACFEKGKAKNTYGTGCFLLMNTGDDPIVSKNNLLTTVAWKIGDRTEYALEGSVFIAGAAIQWLRDGLGMIRDAAESESLAASVPDNGGLYLVPAFSGLGAPHWDPYARGSMSGITRGTTAAHFARAALESIAFQSSDLLDAMNRDSGIDLKELRVDGGACANNLLMQFQADLLGVPVVRPKVSETTAMGAACLAGLGVGIWKAREEIAEHWEVDRQFDPRMPSEDVSRLKKGWRRALERAKGWIEETVETDNG